MEKILTGYCRTCDASRMVLVDSEDGEADCEFPACAYSAGCPVAAEIRAFLNESTSVHAGTTQSGEIPKK